MCPFEKWIKEVNWSLVISCFQGLLTPVIAGAVAYIARQQWKTSANKVKLDLFDRRYRVFEEVRKLRELIYPSVRLQKSNIEAFKAGTVEAQFLFGADIEEYLREMSERANALENLEWKLNNAPGGDPGNRIGIVEARRSGIVCLEKRFNEAEKMFTKYLDFSKL